MSPPRYLPLFWLLTTWISFAWLWTWACYKWNYQGIFCCARSFTQHYVWDLSIPLVRCSFICLFPLLKKYTYIYVFLHFHSFPIGLLVKNPCANADTQEMWVWSLGWEDPLEEEMATHSSIIAWRIPWTEEPGRVTKSDQRVTKSQTGLKWLSTHINTVEENPDRKNIRKVWKDHTIQNAITAMTASSLKQYIPAWENCVWMCTSS